MTCFAVIAGGGTSGHVLPALAIAELLIDNGRQHNEIVYFGARRGIETQLVPSSGMSAHFFDVIGLKRELSLGAVRSNLLFAPKLALAWRQATRLLRKLQPSVVVSVGGYASLPAVLGARWLKIPVVVVTYDRTPGRSSALTSRFAAAVASAFPESPLPRSHFTGAPVRRELRTLERGSQRQAARARLGIAQDSFFIGVIGGSLGSGILNDAVLDYVKDHRGDAQVALRHVVGERFINAYRSSLMDAEISFIEPDLVSETHQPGIDPGVGFRYQIVGYQDDMASLYAAVDVLIGRGGAGTVAEVAVTGTPAILIPWSGAAEDHQTDNVRWLADSGGAIFLTESACRAELSPLLDSLQHDAEYLESLGQNAYVLGEMNRIGAIAQLIEKVASEPVTL